MNATVGFVEMTKSCARDLTNRIKAGVNDVADMLARAHEERAWAALGYSSWKDYCAAEFEMTKQRSYQLLDFVKIRNSLAESQPGLTLPSSERQTRALAKLSAEQQEVVWVAAVDAAGGEQPTPKEVRAVVVEVLEPEPVVIRAYVEKPRAEEPEQPAALVLKAHNKTFRIEHPPESWHVVRYANVPDHSEHIVCSKCWTFSLGGMSGVNNWHYECECENGHSDAAIETRVAMSA